VSLELHYVSSGCELLDLKFVSSVNVLTCSFFWWDMLFSEGAS